MFASNYGLSLYALPMFCVPSGGHVVFVSRFSLSRRFMLQSACRCVKFSPAPLDLLAFTENEDFVHVVDLRRLDVMQACPL